jgi:hypothetical protein
MYKVLCDGNLLFDPRVDDLKIFDSELRLEVNKVGRFDFTIYPTHPLYGSIQKLKSVIEVYQDNTLIFRGRVLADKMAFNKNKSIECEGDLAFFNDSILRPYEFTGSISDYLQEIITSHNAQVESNKQFTLGNVTVTDPNNLIVRSNVNHVKSWDEINDKLLGPLGGYIVLRRQNDINYIDYLIDSPYQSLQSIELGQNLLGVLKDTRSDDIITALIPLGGKLMDDEGNETSERLTIASVNGGVDYVYDQAAVDEYGWIFGTHIWDGVNDPNILLTRANSRLALLINLGVSIELKAIDLSMVDVDIDKIRVFEYVNVKSDPHGINIMALITKLNIDLLQPNNNTVTLGFSYDTFTDKQVASDSALRQIQSDYVTNQSVQDVRSSLVTLASSIEQTAEAVRIEVAQNFTSKGELDTYKSQVSTQFTQTATDYTFLFNQLEQYLSTLDDETQTQFNEITKYIRFVNGNIVLGEVGNQITLVIQNDRIGFLQNGSEVAYFSNNRLYVYDGQFINSLRLGNFSFIPRSNGSLDFKKVG